MEQFILILHVLIAIAMTFFILMQQGKGAEMGASFGAGSSQTVFGSAGSAGFLTKATGVLALAFFVTSITLAFFAKKKIEQPVASVIAPVVEAAPVAPANPDVPAAAASQPVAPAAPASPPVTATPVAAPAVPAVAVDRAVKPAPVKKVAPVEAAPAPVEAPAPVAAPAAPVSETPADAAAGSSNP
ncbi:MAG TPA: preprotein translocase subunit SecG [Fluviicoccus sp.]|nr:preprotein translocase subunit SecG [Fluviicoccus sp.]